MSDPLTGLAHERARDRAHYARISSRPPRCRMCLICCGAATPMWCVLNEARSDVSTPRSLQLDGLVAYAITLGQIRRRRQGGRRERSRRSNQRQIGIARRGVSLLCEVSLSEPSARAAPRAVAALVEFARPDAPSLAGSSSRPSAKPFPPGTDGSAAGESPVPLTRPSPRPGVSRCPGGVSPFAGVSADAPGACAPGNPLPVKGSRISPGATFNVPEGTSGPTPLPMFWIPPRPRFGSGTFACAGRPPLSAKAEIDPVATNEATSRALARARLRPAARRAPEDESSSRTIRAGAARARSGAGATLTRRKLVLSFPIRWLQARITGARTHLTQTSCHRVGSRYLM